MEIKLGLLILIVIVFLAPFCIVPRNKILFGAITWGFVLIMLVIAYLLEKLPIIILW